MTAINDNQISPIRGRGISIALWVAQALLAALFIFSGVMKFVMPAAQMAQQTSLSVSFIHFIGVCEVLGGIGLVVPALLRIMPVLTPIAACALAIIMVGAVYYTLPMGAMAAVPFATGVLALFIAFGRFRLRPIASRP